MSRRRFLTLSLFSFFSNFPPPDFLIFKNIDVENDKIVTVNVAIEKWFKINEKEVVDQPLEHVINEPKILRLVEEIKETELEGTFTRDLPIVLNEKKDKIISYPGINDIYYNGKLALPEKLESGYYLDNMGISPNSVYTSYTFN